jgi:hypothetical protein
MKNTIYAVVIGVCILGAIVVFVSRRGRSGGGIDSIDAAQMIWVKCAKCGQSYEMSEKQYFKELEEIANSVPGDFEDRCPKCKHSATEAKRKARLGQQ